MAITRQKKEEIVAKVSDIARSAKTLVFANFKGLTVAEQNEMRKALRPLGVGYTVAKKSLLRRALESAGFSGQAPELEGEIALAYGDDELAPAREMAVFVKKFGEHLAFAGGMFGGAYVGKDEIISIASIPGLDGLRAQFVQLINSPRQRLAIVLNARADKIK
ncbi:50S ribosomal protein L10 [Candidatus Adlerbacteria bacterium RIFCSPHIGHO2_02_FULL_54_18]|uniref:Large ribosomal subunit protein uL10 n=2 Tax=Candidatus Adleribacteriota TaxID=1752736 RepID=A0A1F4Y4Z9_9BACT|nr:MAG: 50S ribosomal protein L10 [Candidatus Adlerbacteria bacterium RIFCSPLOWO2_01_FULL_54_21b]OGC89045.1 MAG: 50S ribosomal protein L10 [Candidatus Adlerbacteria bacterium RIFCSPHIGHO2_02_FULL_54_18]